MAEVVKEILETLLPNKRRSSTIVQLKISKLLLYVRVIFVAEFSNYNRFQWQGISAILAILSEQMGKNAKITFWDFVKVCFSFCYGALSIYDD